ncbi:MAG TPA: HAD family phosphatase [Nitrospirales bacterium]|nr:HAD family phosphatase [Nitrospirales bacterium]
MLQAIIFDFDGVIADSEPLHYAAFRHVLAEELIPLTESQYYTDYIGMDDKGCFSAVLTRHSRIPSPDVIADLIRRKSTYFNQHVTANLRLFEGVIDFIPMVAKRWPLAIVSGALRDEIELILGGAKLRDAFHAIISAEDVNEGKPSPEGFLKGLDALNRLEGQPTVKPADCLVIEDTIPGVEGARAAGMRCLAVTNTSPREELTHADAVTDSLANYDIDALERKLWDE